MVMAQSLFKQLKHQNPNCVIDVLAPAWSKPLLARMPEVRDAISSPFAHRQLKLFQRYRLARQLRQKHYDQAIVLPRSFKAALIPLWAKIPKRTGWQGEQRYGLLNDCRKLDKQRYPLMVERYVALASPADATKASLSSPQLQVDAESIEAVKRKFQLDEDKIIALCPGAEYGPAKRWPAKYFAQVAQACKAEGWQVVLMGSAKDKMIADEIQQLCASSCTDLTGKTSLAEAIDIIAACDQVICNDSGLMHIAAALEKPSIAIYGSSDLGYTPPLSRKTKTIKLDLPCSPCFKRECPLQTYECLEKISPKLILDEL